MQRLIDRFDALPVWQRLMYAGIVILVAILINPLSKALAGMLFIVRVCGALYGLVFRTGNAWAWVNVGAGAFILLIIVGFFQPIRVSTTSSPAPAPAPAPAAAPSPAPAPAPAPATASKKSSDDVAVRDRAPQALTALAAMAPHKASEPSTASWRLKLRSTMQRPKQVDSSLMP